ncbi:hypothetical protein HY991_01955 [Candidatus Micrarchaeota archaeon]|nr:hypothetical protein [Candidatus Micrarchaeota archaeon]
MSFLRGLLRRNKKTTMVFTVIFIILGVILFGVVEKFFKGGQSIDYNTCFAQIVSMAGCWYENGTFKPQGIISDRDTPACANAWVNSSDNNRCGYCTPCYEIK